MAAKPPTNAPIRAVIKIKEMYELPKENNWAIFWDKILSFLLSIQKAKRLHKRKIPRNPEKKLFPMLCGISKATANAIIAMLHQGR